jgi:hypothetical protein
MTRQNQPGFKWMIGVDGNPTPTHEEIQQIYENLRNLRHELGFNLSEDPYTQKVHDTILGALLDMQRDFEALKQEDIFYCLNCNSVLGIDCGESEPDYSLSFCSIRCFLDSKLSGGQS